MDKPPHPKRPAANRKPFPHADDRHGDGWPRAPRKGINRWCGWLTIREYDTIEYHTRFDDSDMYSVGSSRGLPQDSCNRMFYSMKDAGIIDGLPHTFWVTPRGRMLFEMTDQYILGLSLEDE